MRPNLQAQLKATINFRRHGDDYRFTLKKKNYDDLRVQTRVPRIVVVLALPRRPVDWLNISVKRLIMRRCAFWASLTGMPELRENQQSTSITIVGANRFDVEGLRRLMDMARIGAIS